MPNRLTFPALLALALALPAQAALAASNWPPDLPPRPKASLIAEYSALGGKNQIIAGIRLQLGPRWKTYWRNPGAGGLPPRFDWTGSKNLKHAQILYPAPARFALPGGDLYGYGREVVFPVQVKLRNPAAALALRLKLDYAVCDQVCVPLEETLALDLPAAGDARTTPQAALLQTYARQVPQGDRRAGGIRLARLSFRQISPRTGEILLTFAAPAPFTKPLLIAEAPDGHVFGPPVRHKTEKRKNAFQTRFQFPVEAENPLNLAGRSFGILLRDGGRLLEMRPRIPQNPAKPKN